MESIIYNGKFTNAEVMIDIIDEATSGQIIKFINDSSFTNPIKIMPDCHYGKGAVIGFTMEMTDRIIPNIVGVDLNCGLFTVVIKMPKDKISLFKTNEFDKFIRSKIPTGNNIHKTPAVNLEKTIPWNKINTRCSEMTNKLNMKFNTSFKPPVYDFKWFTNMCKRVGEKIEYALCSCGTLGGGNHFMSIDCDDISGLSAITVHSGSRHLGFKIANYWQNVAIQRLKNIDYKAQIDTLKRTYSKDKWQSMIIDLKAKTKVNKGLEYLLDEDMFNYMCDMLFTKYYAIASRKYMVNIIYEAIKCPPEICRIHTIHNYIDSKDLIIRKGAVSSYKGKPLVIPLNMEDGILICEGNSNSNWNFSAPHGAGRVLSRSRAKEILNINKAISSINSKGIFSSSIPVDELKDAYKPSNTIIKAIKPTAKILYHMKPIINFKSM